MCVFKRILTYRKKKQFQYKPIQNKFIYYSSRVSRKVIEANPPQVSVTIADFGYHVSCSQKLRIVWISNMLTLSYEGYYRIES